MAELPGLAAGFFSDCDLAWTEGSVTAPLVQGLSWVPTGKSGEDVHSQQPRCNRWSDEGVTQGSAAEVALLHVADQGSKHPNMKHIP